MCLQHFTTQVTLPSSLAEKAKTSDKGTTALGEALHSIVCLVCVGVSVYSVSLRLQSLWCGFLQRRAECEQRSSRIRTGAVPPVRSEPLLLAALPREPQKPASSTMSRPVMLNERNHQLFFPRMIFFSSDANDRSADLYQIIDLIPQMLQYCSYHQVAKTWIFTDNIFFKTHQTH